MPGKFVLVEMLEGEASLFSKPLGSMRDPDLDSLLTGSVSVIAVTRGHGNQVAAFLIPNNPDGRKAIAKLIEKDVQ